MVAGSMVGGVLFGSDPTTANVNMRGVEVAWGETARRTRKLGDGVVVVVGEVVEEVNAARQICTHTHTHAHTHTHTRNKNCAVATA
jgi:hypothetical protein